MQYLLTIVRHFEETRDDGRKHRHETRDHLPCESRKEAEAMAEELNTLFSHAYDKRATVSLKVYRPEGGSVVMPLADWMMIAESIIDNDGNSEDKPAFAA